MIHSTNEGGAAQHTQGKLPPQNNDDDDDNDNDNSKPWY